MKMKMNTVKSVVIGAIMSFAVGLSAWADTVIDPTVTTSQNVYAYEHAIVTAASIGNQAWTASSADTAYLTVDASGARGTDVRIYCVKAGTKKVTITAGTKTYTVQIKAVANRQQGLEACEVKCCDIPRNRRPDERGRRNGYSRTRLDCQHGGPANYL